MTNMTERERRFIESLEREASVMVPKEEYLRLKRAEELLELKKERQYN